MKKLDISTLTSNLLVLSSVLLAAVPALLGDKLVLVAGNVAREGASVIQGFASSLMGLLS
ncbi:MAG: hypothetical protein ACREBG_22820 [Pyrinomonadaceae bacterium]